VTKINETTFSRLEKVFFDDGYRLAKCHLAKPLDKEKLIGLANEIYSYLDEFLASFSSACAGQGKIITCRKACYYCCWQTVMILPHEIFPVLEYMGKNFSTKQKESVFKKALEKDSQTRDMPANQFMHLKHPCPFLENNSCSIYPVRPSSCRVFLSSDISTCQQELRDPLDFSNIPDVYHLPLQVGRMVNAGVSRYLTGVGIHSNDWFFEAYLCRAKGNPDGLFNDWAKGGDSLTFRQLSVKEIYYMDNLKK
jgi:Fe-S-cluster containining protein